MATTLKEQFHTFLSLNGITNFRTQDALRWYAENKSSKGRVDYSNLYTLILRPLEYQGIIKKHIVHGLWEVVEAIAFQDIEDEELDDFDKYIMEKMKG